MPNTIGNLLKEKRVNKKITITELSKLLEIPVTSISQIENNKKYNRVYLFRLCNYYNLNYENILSLKWDLNCNEFINNRGLYARN